MKNQKYIPKFCPGDKVIVVNPRTGKKEPGTMYNVSIGMYGACYSVNLDRKRKNGVSLNSVHVGDKDLELIK